ncbi:hypothetical protein [Futiania mangrovi]|uniref:Uncharacterized protein n=1 Tax=Futiania mangrovi TaxID=2959716 RepID=A0A9J6PGF1_9PROT|nr:hypothetical protein [Futiania mangrovii]MCP1337558.1 hypothetical protein [Futiania mangrovii]
MENHPQTWGTSTVMFLDPLSRQGAGVPFDDAFPVIAPPAAGQETPPSASLVANVAPSSVTSACNDLMSSILQYAGLMGSAQERLNDARQGGRTADMREILRQIVQLAAAASELCDRFRNDCAFESEVPMYLQIKVTALCRKLEQIGDAAEEGLAALGRPGLQIDLGEIGDLLGGGVDLLMALFSGLAAFLGGQRQGAF